MTLLKHDDENIEFSQVENELFVKILKKKFPPKDGFRSLPDALFDAVCLSQMLKNNLTNPNKDDQTLANSIILESMKSCYAVVINNILDDISDSQKICMVDAGYSVIRVLDHNTEEPLLGRSVTLKFVGGDYSELVTYCSDDTDMNLLRDEYGQVYDYEHILYYAMITGNIITNIHRYRKPNVINEKICTAFGLQSTIPDIL